MKRHNLQGQVVRLETEKLHLENEIERLNNIINELEKWIKEILLSKAYSIGYKEAYKDIYMKLQELKGSESDE